MSIYAIRNGLRTWAETTPVSFGWGSAPYPCIMTPDKARGIYAIPRCGSVSLIFAMAKAYHPKAWDALTRAKHDGDPDILPELAYRIGEDCGMLFTDTPQDAELYAVIRHPLSRIKSSLERMSLREEFLTTVPGRGAFVSIGEGCKTPNEILIHLSKHPVNMVDPHFRPYFVGMRDNVKDVYTMEGGGLQEIANVMDLEIEHENKTDGVRMKLDEAQEYFISNMYRADISFWEGVRQNEIDQRGG